MNAHSLFTYPFMINALRAGTIVAVMAGVMGWYMVVRKQTFAGHTISIVGFPGAAGATWLGIPATAGFFTFCVAAAAAIAAMPRAGRRSGFGDESATIGATQALLLASGFLFVNLFAGNLNGSSALLFGNFLGITWAQVVTLFAVAVPALAILVVIARPLLFASVDPDVAVAAGVPVRALSTAFMILLGVAVGEASQITGALLVFALLVVPAATSQALTARPMRGLAVSVVIAIAITWGGLILAYFSSYPTGAFITSLSFVAYAGARARAAWHARSPRAVVTGARA